jgi:hypothetical protein
VRPFARVLVDDELLNAGCEGGHPFDSGMSAFPDQAGPARAERVTIFGRGGGSFR